LQIKFVNYALTPNIEAVYSALTNCTHLRTIGLYARSSNALKWSAEQMQAWSMLRKFETDLKFDLQQLIHPAEQVRQFLGFFVLNLATFQT
jgi:hypothetical protein